MRFVAGTLLTLAMLSSLVAQQSVTPGTAIAAQPPSAAAPGTPISPPQTATAAGSSGQAAAQPPIPSAANTAGQPSPPQTPSPDQPALATLPPGTAILPTVSRREASEAKRQFRQGVKLKSKGELDEAFSKFSSASELDPRNPDYITAREFARQELALRALQRGNKAMLDHNEIVAMAEFRRALEYDPTNDYALQRLRDAIPADEQPARPVSVVEQSTPIELRPAAQHHDFHFRGDSRTLLTEVARAYGISAQYDDSVKQQRVHFDMQDVSFATAMQAAADVTKTFWVVLSPSQIFFLPDTIENRRNFERMGLRTFYLPELSEQELAELVNSLRVLLNLRFISQDKSELTVSIRGELPVLEAADRLIRSLTTGRPEVLLDVRVYAVNSDFARSLGTALPTQFTMFNISPALLAGLGQNAQNLINQLISSGGINQANSQAISALLAQLQNSSTSSILTQPFVTFGGGLTLFGLNGGGGGLTPTFSLNQSDIRNLEHVTLHASQGDAATMKIGERFPIVNATYAPIYNSRSIASVIGNQSYLAPFPSFSFEDLGLNLKTTPFIHDNQDVTLKVDLQLRSLGAQNVNGIPIINNTQYTGTITVKNGESSVVTGLISLNDSRSINGYPFLSQIPGLGYGSSVHNKNVTEEELLVVITPHIMRLPDQSSFAAELPPAH
ncbi:MAG TPA: type II and III secretion system protein [Candidatus Binatia bacterium]|nr:type II and III secretion system protein [Candidatus Binatia bacterium]